MLNFIENRPLDAHNRFLLRKDLLNFSFIMLEKQKEDAIDESVMDMILADIFRAHSLLEDVFFDELKGESEIELVDYVTNVYSLYVTTYYVPEKLVGEKYLNYVNQMDNEEVEVN